MRWGDRMRAGFWGDARGSVLPIFGLVLTALLLLAGVAVDLGRMSNTRSILAFAADAGVLAGGRALLEGQSDAAVEAAALNYFNTNLASGTKGDAVGDVDVAVKVNRVTGKVEVSAQSVLPMTLMKLAGYNEFVIPANASAVFDQRDIELSMVLDVTGSMGTPGSKIAALRSAAKDLVDIMLPDEGAQVNARIALAPYSSSVNAGAFAQAVSGGASNACVHERGKDEAFTDAPPGPNQYLGTSNGLACPAATVVPLTKDKALLKREIDTYQPFGTTAGHVGAAWGWYLVSPKWSGIWTSSSAPAEYDSTKTLKAVLLMTDGEFNRWYVNSNGSSIAQARKVCTSMKDAGVTVFAVAFMSPANAQALLRFCASSNSHYFSAEDGNALRVSFQEIAKNLGRLRLTQ